MECVLDKITNFHEIRPIPSKYKCGTSCIICHYSGMNDCILLNYELGPCNVAACIECREKCFNEIKIYKEKQYSKYVKCILYLSNIIIKDISRKIIESYYMIYGILRISDDNVEMFKKYS